MNEIRQDKPISLQLMKLLLAVWWWGLIVAGVLFVGWVVTRDADNIEVAMLGYASDIETSAMMAEDRNGQQLAVEFDGPAKVKLILPNEPGQRNLTIGHKIISLAIMVPFFIVCVYFVKLLRDIVRTIDQGDPFAEENAQRVRTIGGLILLFELVRSAGQLAISGFADSMVIAQGFNLSGRLEVNVGLLVVGTAVIVLSEVFRHGSRMREEQSLTV